MAAVSEAEAAAVVGVMRDANLTSGCVFGVPIPAAHDLGTGTIQWLNEKQHPIVLQRVCLCFTQLCHNSVLDIDIAIDAAVDEAVVSAGEKCEWWFFRCGHTTRA